MRLLVTGGAGYIGSVVAGHLVADGHDVVLLDDLVTGHADVVPRIAVHAAGGGSVALVEGSVEDAADVLDPSFDGVLHFAARSQVGESATHPEVYWRTNVGGSLALLEAVRTAGIARLVCSSTAAVYGEPAEVPISEEAPAVPVSTYGATKLAVDHAIASYCAAHDLGAVSLRYFNVVGAWGGLGERHDPETHLVPRLLVAARDGSPVSVYGTDYPTRDGTAIRDYLHVADLAEAHLAALAACRPGIHEIINLGTSNGSTVREVITAVEAVTGRALAVEEAPRRPGDPAALVASPARAADRLGWQPRRSLDEAVADAWAVMPAG